MFDCRESGGETSRMSEAEKMFEEMPERDSVSSVSGKVFPRKSILLEFKSSVSDPSGILSCWNSDNLISVPGSGSPATRILGFPRSVSLAVVAKETESEEIVSKLSIPHTWFDLQYVRPDFDIDDMEMEAFVRICDWSMCFSWQVEVLCDSHVTHEIRSI